MHFTSKNWVCDCCGSRFGNKQVLRPHLMTHLPPSFACSICPKAFWHTTHLKNHLKRHAGVVSAVCKHCNKGFPTFSGRNNHIVNHHFSQLSCEVPKCTYKSAAKGIFKRHFKRKHKNVDKNLIAQLLEKMDKLKPDYNLLKYV